MATTPSNPMPAGSSPSAAERAIAAARKGRPRSVAARKAGESVVKAGLLACALFSIFVTTAIVVVLVRQTVSFFGMPEASVTDFVFGTTWSPLLGEEKHFGIWPLINGTVLVSVIAAAFALPVGLVAAIYLSEYAPPRVRATIKPTLEVLAGVPTVVFGFFAINFITPGLQLVSERFGFYNATGAGLAVGMMILPIVCSLSEDALRAVPRSLRDGAYALGSTKFDVSVRVVVPAALSGIVAAFLLAVTRAIGETMIVALAAGGLANLTIAPWAETQTMTAYMVQIFLGDAPADGVEYKSSYAVAFVLFLMTLGLTMAGNAALRWFREEYE